MENRSILISGAGIAGPTLAYWLIRHGFRPTIVERAPALRGGGYVIDFWGLGYDIAEQMGLLPAIDRAGYYVRELRIVDKRGQRAAGFGMMVLKELTGGRYVTLARSDLSRLVFDKIKNSVEIIFSDGITSLDEDAAGVNVTFEYARQRRFDLVIGADGLHSRVRELVFGPQERFEKPLGYTVAAFEASGYRPRDEDVYVVYGLPGRQIARFALRGDRTLFLFVFADANEAWPDPHDLTARKARVRARFAGGGWECSSILAELDRADDLYFDRVSQIRMERWWRGRVALVGDAAACLSLLAGQGSALAMTAAYVLAGELAAADGRAETAFPRYENVLRVFIEKKQKAAKRFARSFAPRTRLGLVLRNTITNLFRIPGIARFAMGRDLLDRLALPEYGG